ncbi:hypothetical protein [Pandoraea sp. 64-18]|uniref:hypothetical protein n=1 Tax=Pandoraea sp. 64-18 TaxID=1895806 RepID=UPI00257B47C6|nr:hypothetical protein [Pandoraea sp. 64-18]
MVPFIQYRQAAIQTATAIQIRLSLFNTRHYRLKGREFLRIAPFGFHRNSDGRSNIGDFLIIIQFQIRVEIAFLRQHNRASFFPEHLNAVISVRLPMRHLRRHSVACHRIAGQRCRRHHGRNGHANLRLTQGARLRMVLLHSIIHKLIREK